MEVEAEGLHGDCASGAGCWGTKKTLWCRCDRVRAVQQGQPHGRGAAGAQRHKAGSIYGKARPQTHTVLVSQSPLPAEGVSQMCQPSSTSSRMRCRLLGAWHSTRGSCTVPAAWPEVRLAQRLLSSVFVQPSTSPGRGAHRAGAVLGVSVGLVPAPCCGSAMPPAGAGKPQGRGAETQGAENMGRRGGVGAGSTVWLLPASRIWPPSCSGCPAEEGHCQLCHFQHCEERELSWFSS